MFTTAADSLNTLDVKETPDVVFSLNNNLDPPLPLKSDNILIVNVVIKILSFRVIHFFLHFPFYLLPFFAILLLYLNIFFLHFGYVCIDKYIWN